MREGELKILVTSSTYCLLYSCDVPRNSVIYIMATRGILLLQRYSPATGRRQLNSLRRGAVPSTTTEHYC